MLAILPVVAVAAIVLGLGNLHSDWSWGRVFLRGLIAAGAVLVVGTELLSAARAITPAGLAALWLLPTTASAILLARQLRRGARLRLPALSLPTSWPERILLAGIATGLGITALVAWYAPPQAWDSLTYHLARVAHWAQDRSVAHYATGIARQIQMSPGAELAVLHVYVLAGGDRLANFVQWGAMAASALAAAVLARQMGIRTTGQLFSALFVVTMPVGIAQASSSLTDFVVAMWVAAVASEVLETVAEGEPPKILYLGIGAGMAVLTKLTSLGYLLALAGWLGVGLLRRYGVIRSLRWTAGVAALVLVVNGGHWARNVATYGHPLGSERQITLHSTQFFDWRVVVSNTLRNASLHAGTPSAGLNELLFRALAGLHFKMGLDINDSRTSLERDFRILVPRPDELRSGNLLQALLALVSTIAAGVSAIRGDRQARLVFLLATIVSLGFVVQSTVMRFTVLGSRYQLILFVLLAPVAAWGLKGLRGGAAVAGLVLIAYAWPWFVRLEPRPLVPDRHGLSILTAERDSLYLPRRIEDPYRQITEAIQNAACHSVGLMLSGDSAEYPLWVYLGAPRSDLVMEWIVGGTPSEQYRRPDFQPCAVVCDASCPAEWSEAAGLPLRLNLSGYRLYQAP